VIRVAVFYLQYKKILFIKYGFIVLFGAAAPSKFTLRPGGNNL